MLRRDTRGDNRHFPYRLYLLTCIAASIFIAVVAFNSIISASIAADARQNRLIAFNLAKYGVFSRDNHDSPNLTPTAHREPLYPFYLALLLRVFTDVDNLTYTCLFEERECDSIRLLLNRANIPIYIALVWAFTGAAYWLVRRWWIVWISLILLLYVDYFLYYTNFTELLGALLLLLHAMFLYQIVRSLEIDRRPYKSAILSGLSLGALLLVKAIFQYWLVLLAIGGGLILLWRFRQNSVMIRSWLLLVATASIIIMPWLARNYVHFREARLADGRDGLVLAVRAEFSYMTWSEYLASFAYFSPQLLSQALTPLFDEEDTYRLQRSIDGSLNPDSFYYVATRQTGFVGERMRERSMSMNDAALSIIRDRWLQHTAIILPLAWRGSFLDGPLIGSMRSHRVISSENMRMPYYGIAGIIGMAFVPSMLGVAVYALRKRKWALLMFLMPALYSFAIHAAITHYHPRYSAPLVPIMIIALGIVINGVVSRIGGRQPVHVAQRHTSNENRS